MGLSEGIVFMREFCVYWIDCDGGYGYWLIGFGFVFDCCSGIGIFELFRGYFGCFCGEFFVEVFVFCFFECFWDWVGCFGFWIVGCFIVREDFLNGVWEKVVFVDVELCRCWIESGVVVCV